jgi:fused signal recognition particle receptor
LYSGATDTFRTAAIDQLQVWADRVGVPIVRQNMGSDPASMLLIRYSRLLPKMQIFVIRDTQVVCTIKINLMNELTKVKE